MSVWQKLLQFFPVLANGASGATPAVNWDAATTQSITLNAATVTPTFVNPPAGTELRLLLTQDGAGGRLVVWPGAVSWIGGQAPTLISTPGATSEVMLTWDGTTYWGSFPSALGTGLGAIEEVRFAINNAAAQNSATSLPNGAIVTDAELDITVAFSGGATIEVGNAGTPTALMGTGDNVATSLGLYAVHQDTTWVGPATILVTVGGAPAGGAGFCIVRYVKVPQT
jgi:hypothetical protein